MNDLIMKRGTDHNESVVTSHTQLLCPLNSKILSLKTNVKKDDIKIVMWKCCII